MIDGAIDHMRRAYVFADVADKMAEALRAHEAARAYEIATPREFAETLTQHLQEVSRDKHLRIIYAPDGLPQRTAPTAADRARALAEERRRLRVSARGTARRQRGLHRAPRLQRLGGSRGSRRSRHELPRERRRAHLRPAPQRRRFTGHHRSAFELPLRRGRASQRLLYPRNRHATGVLHQGHRGRPQVRCDQTGDAHQQPHLLSR